MVMDLLQLRSFAEVVERGTVAAAALSLGYTAPAISQHLGKLEASLGASLFDRAGGRLSLTPAGASLLPIALEMLDLDARARAEVQTPSGRPVVTVVGLASAIASIVVPRLGRLREAVTLRLSEAEDDDALRELGLGAVDVVLTQEYSGAVAHRRRRFTYTPLGEDALELVLPPDHPPTTTLDALHDAPWILNGQRTRCAEATRRVLDGAGIDARVVGVIDDHATLLGLVSAGYGVAMLPARVLEQARQPVTVARQRLGVSRTLLAVTRTSMTTALASVLTLLSEPPARHR